MFEENVECEFDCRCNQCGELIKRGDLVTRSLTDDGEFILAIWHQ